MADLLGGRPTLGPHGLAVTEAGPAALDRLAVLDTAMRAVETVRPAKAVHDGTHVDAETSFAAVLGALPPPD